jgi:cysteine desulfuration protein SufE
VAARSPSLPPGLRSVLDDLARLPDRAERIEALISTARRFIPVAAEVAPRPYPDAAKVPACESQAYLFTTPRPDGTLDLHFAVENPQGISAMALATILRESLSGAPLDEVASVPTDVVYDIFGSELSMGKSMGLTGMVAMAAAAARRAAASTRASS